MWTDRRWSPRHAAGSLPYGCGVTTVEIASRLAVRHEQTVEPDPDTSLTNYAESSRRGDWTLRSSLVRLAQPEPVRAGAVLELIRRCDAAIGPLSRSVLRHTVPIDSDLAAGDWAREDRPAGQPIDGRVVDLARLAAADPSGFPEALTVYRERVQLDDDELAALPLLGVAIMLDELAEILVAWAAGGAGLDPPPVDDVDRLCALAFERLEELGVPREELPPGVRPRR